MWLCDSSIGRKVVMSVTGLALILFLTFHACMNVVALFSGKAYNMICELLGANWYAVVAVTNKPEKVEWYSQNMFLLGVIVVLGLCLHLYNFWYNMMWSELMGNAYTQLPSPSDGYAWIEQTFAQPVFVVLYVIWLCAIWFHINHGFWSAIQTLGWSGKIWLNRWQCIGFWWSTIVILMFFAVLVKFAFFA